MSLRQTVLPFKLEITDTPDLVTGRAALPVIVELMRTLFRRSWYIRLAKALNYGHWTTARRHLESLVLLVADGGEHLSDLDHLRADAALPKLLGFEISSASQAKDFLYRFHQAANGDPLTDEDDQHLSQRGHATIRDEGPGLRVLRSYVAETVNTSQLLDPQQVATMDVDATIIEAIKKAALRAYEGTVGYQPQGAWWAEQSLWFGDQFRDGNVPAQYKILDFVQQMVALLPKGIRKVRFRGDSALYDHGLMDWLDDNQIDFAISADMSPQLTAVIREVPEKDWKPYVGNRAQKVPREERQWAEVAFVPERAGNYKKHGTPLRYIAIRVRSRQRDLLEDDERRWRHFAVVTNIYAWQGEHVLRWHRMKQGSVERANGIVKNDLGGGVMPTGRFGANAAWWRLNILAHNLLELLKLLLPDELAMVHPKTLRFRFLRMAGRVVQHARRWVLRISVALPLAEAYQRLRTILADWLGGDLPDIAMAG